ncbi:MAG: hypothetical protein Q7T86_10430 [Hyphomicrobiaceae bacterium]|nr:hypothetical protein [Hyphomicrobiaceae bacterium]
MTNISRRFAERGDGGADGSTGPGSPLTDLVNNRLTFKFILPIGWTDILANFPPARDYVCVMVTGRSWTSFAALLWHGSRGPTSVLG